MIKSQILGLMVFSIISATSVALIVFANIYITVRSEIITNAALEIMKISTSALAGAAAVLIGERR